VYHRAKFHADRCHRRRDICRADRERANLVACHTNVCRVTTFFSVYRLRSFRCLLGLRFLPRDAMQARPMSSCSVRVCVCVCVSVTFVNSVETNKHIFKMFSPPGSKAVLVFPYQTAWQYSDGKLLTGALNVGGIGRNRNAEPIIIWLRLVPFRFQ